MFRLGPSTIKVEFYVHKLLKLYTIDLYPSTYASYAEMVCHVCCVRLLSHVSPFFLSLSSLKHFIEQVLSDVELAVRLSFLSMSVSTRHMLHLLIMDTWVQPRERA